MSNSPQTDVENVLRNLLVFQEQLTSHQEELQIRLPNSPRCENQHANSCICSDLSSVLSNGNIYSLIQKLEQENISSAITALEKVCHYFPTCFFLYVRKIHILKLPEQTSMIT